MNKRRYNFLANYQWYFVGVFIYVFFRGFDDVANSLILKCWFIASGLITLYTQFYFYRHKNHKPEYKWGYVVLSALVTVLLFELYYAPQ
jgi:uncharacterized membrane protein